MLFVKFLGEANFESGEVRYVDVKNLSSRISMKHRVDKTCFVTMYDEYKMQMRFIAGFDPQKASLETCFDAIREECGFVEFSGVEEITLEEFALLLDTSERNDFLGRSARYILNDLGLHIKPDGFSFFSGPPYVLKERVYSASDISKRKLSIMLNRIMASGSMYEEFERIFSPDNEQEFKGHPVHYYITAGDKSAADEMIDILIPALLKNNRLLGGRVCDIQKMNEKAYREENFFNIFRSSIGGTVIINLAVEGKSGQYASAYHELLDQIGKMILDFGNSTLFIFVDISKDRNISDEAMGTILGNADMVHLSEGYGDKNRAVRYLRRLAAKTNYKDYDIGELIKFLPEEKSEYTVTDVYGAFNRWYGKGLKNHVYRAYAEVDTVKIEIPKKTCTAYEELQKMIGLNSVKQVVEEIIAQGRIRRMRERMGLEDINTSSHMLFYGNPGSAKTTVARLISEILKDEEILTNGHIVECGRQDLVGKYVGWTAQIVESKFRAARGGILFIDEAYSLVEDHNSFGAEAINTIVQLMENYRNEVIVIFAGYPDKMKTFLDQNEGLRSRIAFHLNFLDYNAEELTDIARLMISKRGFKASSEAVYDKCRAIFEVACQVQDFGNGRFVRNLIEHAILRQSYRLIKECEGKELTAEDAVTLTEDDIEMIEYKSQPAKKTFGFAS